MSRRGPITRTLEETQEIVKSPFLEGLSGVARGGVIGAPLGAIVGHLSGGSALKGGFAGGLLAAAAFGAANYLTKDIQNTETEAEMRVHLENLKDREPFFFMPPRPLFARAVKSVR